MIYKSFSILKAWFLPCFLVVTCFVCTLQLKAYNHDSLRIALQKKLSKTAYCDTLNEIAYSFSFKDYALCRSYLDEAEKMSMAIGYDQGVETSKKYRGHLAYLSADYELAKKIYFNLIEIHQKKNNIGELYKIYNNLANAYILPGDFETGMVYLLKAHECAETFNDPDVMVKISINIANLYGRMNSNQSQYEYLLKALRYKPSGVDQWWCLTEVYSAISTYYAGLEKHDSAMKYMVMAEKSAYKDIPGRREFILSDVYNNMGYIAIAKGDYVIAKQYLEKALEKYRITGGQEGASSAYISLASVYYNEAFLLRDGDPQTRRKLLVSKCLYDSAQAIAHTHYLTNQMSVIYKYKPSVFYQLGEKDSAYLYLSKYVKLSDSLLSAEKEVKIKEMQLRYETEKREKELLTLQKQNAESRAVAEHRKTVLVLTVSICLLIICGFVMFAVRSRINKKRLSAEFLKNRIELEHKALRAQMNPHFLFNSLNSIQRMFVEGKTDAANEVMADFSSLLRRILNNSGKIRISLKEELDTLRLYLDIEKIRCDNCFDYEIVLEESVDKLNMQVPPLVIQPFAENAIWHGVLPKKSKGHIRIHLSKVLSGDFITCVVLDNGVGMDKNSKSSESKGISITEQRLGTKVIFEDPDNGGTRVILQIPFT